MLISHHQHAATPLLYFMESWFYQKRRWRETLLFFFFFYNHSVPHGFGHTWTQLSGRQMPHYQSCNWHSRRPKSISYPMFALHHRPAMLPNLPLLSGSSERRSHFISSLVHGHAVQHRSTAAISKITVTVWKMRRLRGIMKQNTKLQLCSKGKKKGFHDKLGFY